MALAGALVFFLAGWMGAAGQAAGKGKAPGAAPVTAIDHADAGIIALADGDYYQALRQHIDKASKRIEMAMFVVKTTSSPQNRPAAIVRALVAAHKRGVEVTVILERSDRDRKLTKENRRVGEVLSRGGVAVRYEDPQVTTHAKLVVIDDRYCFVGSHNLTHSALAYNRELSLLVDDEVLARKLSAYMHSLAEGKRKK